MQNKSSTTLSGDTYDDPTALQSYDAAPSGYFLAVEKILRFIVVCTF